MTAPWDKFRTYRNPSEEEKSRIEAGYTWLGWQASSEDSEHLSRCVSLGHNDHRNKDHWESRQHNSRGSDVTYWCDHCRLIWKIDMSD